MPNRILREGALRSDPLAAVDELSEVLFFRLLLLADDFGRFDGRVSVIRALAFTLRQQVRDTELVRRLDELARVGLIVRYESEGKPFLYIPKFDQRMRAKVSKYPEPPTNAGQVSDTRHTSAHGGGDGDGVNPRALHSVLNGAFSEFWDLYPKKKSKGAAEKAWLKIKPDEQLTAKILAAVERAKTSADWKKDGGQFIPHPATWLNAKGWEDEPDLLATTQERKVAL